MFAFFHYQLTNSLLKGKEPIGNFLWALCIVSITGLTLDMLLIESHTSLQNIINIISILILVAVSISYSVFRKAVEIHLSIAIYVLLLNIYISFFLIMHHPDFPFWFIRGSLFVALLLALSALTMHRLNAYFIGVAHISLSVYFTLTTQYQLLVENIAIANTVFIAFTITIIYIVNVIKNKTLSLAKSNKTIEEQKIQLETAYFQLEDINTQLEEELSEIESLNETIKENSELLEKQNIQLKELDATRSRFFSIISHDLKGPLSSIVGLLTSMTMRYDQMPEEKKKIFLAGMQKSAINLYSLLENLLTWSRSQTNNIEFKPQSFKLIELIQKVINMLSDQVNTKRIVIQANIPENITLTADLMMMETIMRNLVTNAIKYSHKGGTIELLATIYNNETVISVRDNGIGMDEKIQKKLFEMGEISSIPGTGGEKGTGLGLLLCNEFVTKHNGHIEIESKPGAGSTFSIHLPV